MYSVIAHCVCERESKRVKVILSAQQWSLWIIKEEIVFSPYWDTGCVRVALRLCVYWLVCLCTIWEPNVRFGSTSLAVTVRPIFCLFCRGVFVLDSGHDKKWVIMHNVLIIIMRPSAFVSLMCVALCMVVSACFPIGTHTLLQLFVCFVFCFVDWHSDSGSLQA